MTTDDVCNARDLVDLALDVTSGLVALDEGLGDRVQREKVNRTFKAALFREARPFVHRDKSIVVTFGHQPLKCGLACVIHATNAQGFHQAINAVGQNVQLHGLILVQDEIGDGNKAVACRGGEQRLRAGPESFQVQRVIALVNDL